MQISLDERIAIVSGAGRGVGAAIARALAAAGTCVAVNDINPDRADRVAMEIRDEGGEAIAVQADVSNKFQCVKLVEATRAQWGRLDVLINAAHVEPSTTILKMDEWDWNRCLEVNVKGVFFMSQLCGRVMNDSERGGMIVNVISEAGVEIPLENRAAFCASQAAVLGFARECRREYAGYGVRVHTLLREHAVRVGAGRVGMQTEKEIAGAVLSLCSGQAASAGAALTVDEVRQMG